MLKSLTARAIVPVAVAVTGFVIVCCIILYSIMKTDMTNDAIKYETNQARTIIRSTRYAMLHDDRETLRNIIDNIGTQEGVEQVRIFNKKGLVMFADDHKEVGKFVDKSTAGCIECHSSPVPAATLGDMKQARRFTNQAGTEIIAITAPIYNEPDCYNAACHVHSSGQKILGTLDIGLSAAPLLKNLALMRSRMIAFSVMILILTVGGVASLLRRNVFVPIRLLAEYADRALKEQPPDQAFPRCGSEIEKLAGDIKTLTHDLRKAREELEQCKRGE